MKRYLITGCAGFIGSNFVYYMLNKYKEIQLVNLDKLNEALRGPSAALLRPGKRTCQRLLASQ